MKSAENSTFGILRFNFSHVESKANQKYFILEANDDDAKSGGSETVKTVCSKIVLQRGCHLQEYFSIQIPFQTCFHSAPLMIGLSLEFGNSVCPSSKLEIKMVLQYYIFC